MCAVPGFRDQSWLNPKIELRPSAIAGLGLFAAAPFDAGEVVSIGGGRLMTDEEFAAHIKGKATYNASAVGEGLNLVMADDDPATYGNHSCDPNTWLTDEVTTVARRTIQPGDEITIDYALMTNSPAWQMVCHCGAASCRGVITGLDWQRPELQIEYAGHFAPFLNKRISGGDIR
jgi:hypothetical protein